MGFDFTLSEDTVLKVSGVSALAYSAFSLASPGVFHETFMEKVCLGRVYSESSSDLQCMSLIGRLYAFVTIARLCWSGEPPLTALAGRHHCRTLADGAPF